jgi:enolase
LNRYRGRGCLNAVEKICSEIRNAVVDREFDSVESLEEFLRRLDGTPDKSRLGANSILAISLAFVRAAALQKQLPLFRYLSECSSFPEMVLPRPLINLFSGGTHAGYQVSLQDIQLVPLRVQSMRDALAVVHEVFQCAAELTHEKYGARRLTADEGGLAPPFPNTEQMFEDTVQAITAAGLLPGKDVSIAVDVAASHFSQERFYLLDGKRIESGEMIERISVWVDDYPIISVEDGLAEDDWEFWPLLADELQGRALTLGDDFLCTNPDRIQRAINTEAADSLLLKVNQIGCLSEAVEAVRLADSAGWEVVFSARSGETEDDWLSDLTVGWGGRKIKIGAITQSDRLAKYNRLLQIEVETGLPLAEW